MPLYQHIQASGEKYEIAIWQITESDEELIAPLPDGFALLNEAHSRFKAVGRRLEWLAVRRLLHAIGCKSSIAYHPTGRPYLLDDNRHISISHTRGYAAVAIHYDYPVGLDIEQRSDKVCRVKNKFLSDEEKVFLLPEKENVDALLVIWTVKEAMFKLIDKEGIDFAEHFHLSPFQMAEEGALVARESFTNERKTFAFRYRIYPDFVLSFATTKAMR